MKEKAGGKGINTHTHTQQQQIAEKMKRKKKEKRSGKKSRKPGHSKEKNKDRNVHKVKRSDERGAKSAIAEKKVLSAAKEYIRPFPWGFLQAQRLRTTIRHPTRLCAS
jgi:hypothetical protein